MLIQGLCIAPEVGEGIIEVVVVEGEGVVDGLIITGPPVEGTSCLIEEDITAVTVTQHGMMKGEYIQTGIMIIEDNALFKLPRYFWAYECSLYMYQGFP